jgi:hypothetical protein
MDTVDDRIVYVRDGRGLVGSSNWSSGADDPMFYGNGGTMVFDDRDVVNHYHQYPEGPRYMGEEIGEEAIGEGEDEVHLRDEEMEGTQEIIVRASITGTMADLAEPTKCIWKIQPNNLNNFRTNTRRLNRRNASDKDLIGDLSKSIIFDVQQMASGNSFPVPLGVEIPECLPKHLTTADAYNTILAPHMPSHNDGGRSIYSPNNLFTRAMYKTHGRCDLKSLKKQIIFPDDDSGEALINISGLAWNRVMEYADRVESWAGSADYLWDIEARRRSDNTRRRKFEPIPQHIAKDVYDDIVMDINDISKAFVDLNKFSVKYARADGREFDSVQGLIGQQSSFGSETGTNYKNHAINRVNHAWVDLKIKYVTW